MRNKICIHEECSTRANFNYKVVKKLKKLQLPLETKKKKSDFVIKTSPLISIMFDLQFFKISVWLNVPA